MKNEYVVLLHGLSRSSVIMKKLEAHFSSDDYQVYNPDYPSTLFTIETLAINLYHRISAACPNKEFPMHFVTHSMGGIIARYIIEKFKPSNLGRVVMIAPPHKGSEVIDFLRKFKLFRDQYGPAALQLTTESHGISHSMEEIDFELGVIAGSRTVDPWFSWFLMPGPSDGKVTIESTKIEGMKDHVVVPASHTYITKNKATIDQAEYFLQHGCFKHG